MEHVPNIVAAEHGAKRLLSKLMRKDGASPDEVPAMPDSEPKRRAGSALKAADHSTASQTNREDKLEKRIITTKHRRVLDLAKSKQDQSKKRKERSDDRDRSGSVNDRYKPVEEEESRGAMFRTKKQKTTTSLAAKAISVATTASSATKHVCAATAGTGLTKGQRKRLREKRKKLEAQHRVATEAQEEDLTVANNSNKDEGKEPNAEDEEKHDGGDIEAGEGFQGGWGYFDNDDDDGEETKADGKETSDKTVAEDQKNPFTSNGSDHPVEQAATNKSNKNRKRHRKKTRSRQKNIRKDTRPTHLKPNYLPVRTKIAGPSSATHRD
eukprot:Clim_evm118s134 gene=Clim_evmTU118s134